MVLEMLNLMIYWEIRVGKDKAYKKCSSLKIIVVALWLFHLPVKVEGVPVLSMLSLRSFCYNVLSSFSNIVFSNIKQRNQSITRYVA